MAATYHTVLNKISENSSERNDFFFQPKPFVSEPSKNNITSIQRMDDAEQTAEESPCEKLSLKNQKTVPCPGGEVLVNPCQWAMFKNAGECDLFISYLNKDEVITVESLDPGAVTECVPSKRCTSYKVFCGDDCDKNGLIKWGPPCII